jgi:hypothetical protein
MDDRHHYAARFVRSTFGRMLTARSLLDFDRARCSSYNIICLLLYILYYKLLRVSRQHCSMIPSQSSTYNGKPSRQAITKPRIQLSPGDGNKDCCLSNLSPLVQMRQTLVVAGLLLNHRVVCVKTRVLPCVCVRTGCLARGPPRGRFQARFCARRDGTQRDATGRNGTQRWNLVGIRFHTLTNQHGRPLCDLYLRNQAPCRFSR